MIHWQGYNGLFATLTSELRIKIYVSFTPELDFSIFDKIHAWHHLHHPRRLDDEIIHLLLADLEVIKDTYIFFGLIQTICCDITRMHCYATWCGSTNEITWIDGLSAIEVCALMDRHIWTNIMHCSVYYIGLNRIGRQIVRDFLDCLPTSVDWKLARLFKVYKVDQTNVDKAKTDGGDT